VLGAQGFATPLHKHRDLDEGFYIVEAARTRARAPHLDRDLLTVTTSLPKFNRARP